MKQRILKWASARHVFECLGCRGLGFSRSIYLWHGTMWLHSLSSPTLSSQSNTIQTDCMRLTSAVLFSSSCQRKAEKILTRTIHHNVCCKLCETNYHCLEASLIQFICVFLSASVFITQNFLWLRPSGDEVWTDEKEKWLFRHAFPRTRQSLLYNCFFPSLPHPSKAHSKALCQTPISASPVWRIMKCYVYS